MHQHYRGAAVVLAFGLLAGPVRAQKVGQSFIGLSGGASLSDMYGYNAQIDSRWGGTAGFLLGYRTASWSAVAVEPAWVQKGGEAGVNSVKLDYLEVPLTFGGVARSRDDRWRFGGYVGITAAFKLGCSSTVILLDCDDATGTEWSTPFGIRFVRMSSSSSGIGLDVKYNLPLSDAWDTQAVDNRTWVFRLIWIKAVGN
jgi:hypothetical protein